MIAISALLVFVAIALLVVGMVQFFMLVYASIAVSALAAILLGVGAFLRRAELFGRDESEGAASEELGALARAQEATVASGTRAPAAVGAATPLSSSDETLDEDGETFPADTAAQAPAADVPEDASVFIVPERRSYHLERCRQLRTRQHQERTIADAVAAGYVACSACMPDTVLAARRSPDEVVAPAAEGAHAEETGSGSEPIEVTSPEDPEGSEDPEDPEGSAGAAAGDEAAADDPDLGDSSPGEPGESEATGGQAGLVGVVRDSRRYHRLTCAVIEDAVQDGIETTTMGRGEADEQELVPCTVCRP